MVSACVLGEVSKKSTFYYTMQTQDAPAEILFQLWPWIEANKNRLIGGAAAAIVIAGIAYFLISQHERREVEAGEALTALMNPSLAASSTQLAGSLEQLAVTYAGTGAAQRAQLQAAGTLFEAGNFTEAQAQFEKLLNDNPTGPFAATAELGVGASDEAQNKLDQAAAAYQRVVSMFSSSPFAAQAEFGLGRIAEQQNKLSEASSHYATVEQKAMGGSLAQEAMIRDSILKLRMAAAAPQPAPKAQPQAAPKPAAAPLTPAKP
jgi:TolA-binding protein